MLAQHTSDTNVQRAAAQARAELSRREQQAWAERFNAESEERIKAQKFQEAQITRQIEAQESLMGEQLGVAMKQADAAESATQAAKQSAIATIALAILTTILAIIAGISVYQAN